MGLTLLQILLLHLSDRRLSQSQSERSRAESTCGIGLLTLEHRGTAYLRTTGNHLPVDAGSYPWRTYVFCAVRTGSDMYLV